MFHERRSILLTYSVERANSEIICFRNTTANWRKLLQKPWVEHVGKGPRIRPHMDTMFKRSSLKEPVFNGPIHPGVYEFLDKECACLNIHLR
ncbi:hypothetical protein Y032_0007g3496 [Ancylostoma ceylanicum]|uniref:Uncharacterized protein n=1 Tax=Ancylostoma ceylanicum TaxID=53326 RepID=A0A016VMT2_9BILA|nr:hypothetical protein Y032_0007g3496 [Ancylostoma ceylanicum]